MKWWLSIIGLLLIVGCVSNQKPVETKIDSTTAIGVLDFRAIVTKMLTNDYNYVLLSIRNNAGGNNARNIIASLENVNPFTIYECQSEHKANDLGTRCNEFFDDVNLPYNTHRVEKMMPDEEIQFLWNIKSPSNEEIVNMVYDHTIYYTLTYDYTTTVTLTVAGMSQSEYLARSKEGPVTLHGQTISSPGELRIESTTQQPIIYNEGSDAPLSFSLNFKLHNNGNGVVTPGSYVIIGVKLDPLVSKSDSASDFGWLDYYVSNDSFSRLIDNAFLIIDYPELTSTVKSEMVWIKIPAEQLVSDDYSLTLPVELNTQNIYEPEKTLTFNVYIYYNYMKEGSTTISVYPTK